MKMTKLVATAIAVAMSFSSVPLICESKVDGVITSVAADTTQPELLPSLKLLSSKQATCYANTEEAAFYMDGRAFYQGIVFRTGILSNNATATFDVSEINSISFTVGHEDNTSLSYNNTFKLYLDGNLVDSMTLTPQTLSSEYSNLNVSNASELTLSFEGTGGSYAVGDISTDKETPVKTSHAFEYTNISSMLASSFNNLQISRYNGDDKSSSFNMNGRTYYQGIVFSTAILDKYSTTSINVENLSNISFTYGHVDGVENVESKLNIYIDDELVDSLSLEWNMELLDYQMDIPDGSKLVRFDVSGSDCKYAIADIHADELDPGLEHYVPTYIKASAFIDRGFNNYESNIRKYTGSSKSDKFTVNGRTYYQGLTFSGSVLSKYASIVFNVENVNHISFSVGRLHDNSANDATLYVYRDNELFEAIEMKAYMPISDFDIDVSECKNIRFVFNTSGESGCAIMNMHVDNMVSDNDYLSPKYDKVSKCIDSLFNMRNIKKYNGSSKTSSFNMNGRTYYEGICLYSEFINNDAKASLNVEDIDTISWTLGHVDDSGFNNGTLYIYLDEELKDTIDLVWSMPLREYTMDVKEGTVLRFFLKTNAATSFALADIKADAREPEIKHIVPIYSNIKEFLSSAFNRSGVTVYNGESPETNNFTMNETKYTQGVIFTGSTSGASENVEFNTENVNGIKFKISHVDGSGDKKSTLSIYKNGVKLEDIELQPDMEIMEKIIDTSDSENVYFFIKHEGASKYAIADIELTDNTMPAVTTTSEVTTTTVTTTNQISTTTSVVESSTATTATGTEATTSAETTTIGLVTTAISTETTAIGTVTTASSTETSATTSGTGTIPINTTPSATGSVTTTSGSGTSTTTSTTGTGIVSTSSGMVTTATGSATGSVTTTSATGTTTTATGSEGSTASSTSQTTVSTSSDEQESTTTETNPVPSENDLGDVNGDGKVDAKDASLILVAYSKASTGESDDLSDEQRVSADVNGDEKIDAKDASFILAYYAMVSTASGEVPSLKEYIMINSNYKNADLVRSAFLLNCKLTLMHTNHSNSSAIYIIQCISIIFLCKRHLLLLCKYISSF